MGTASESPEGSWIRAKLGSAPSDPELSRAFDEERAERIRLRSRWIWAAGIAIWVVSLALVDRAVFTLGQALVVRGVEIGVAAAFLVWLRAPRRVGALEGWSVGGWAAIALVSTVGFTLMPADKLPSKVASLELSCIVVCLLAGFSWRANLAIAAIAALSLSVLPLVGASQLWVMSITVVGFAFGALVVSAAARDRLALAELASRRALVLANERLQAEDELRRRLFVNLSHDLRTPLAVIRGEAEILGAAATDPADAAALARVATNARALADLAAELLDLARLEAGQMPVRAQPCDLARLAAEAAAQLAPPGGAIEVASEAGPTTARVDPVHYARILTNLLANAARQRRADGAPARVRVRLARRGDVVVTEVEDDGPGVPEERRDAIFRRFVSFDEGGTRSAGVGLPLARELARASGGELTLARADGGATFCLSLPATDEPPVDPPARAAEAAAAPRPAAPRAPGQAGRRLVLVVEDNDDMAELVARTLAPSFAVTRAATVAAACEALSPSVAVVVSDVMLPDGSGYDVLGAARARRDLGPIPVVLVSALAEVDERVRGLTAGADDYLPKPFAPEELRRRVETALARADDRRRALDDQRDALLMEVHDGVSASLARAAMLLGEAEAEPLALDGARAAVRDGLDEVRAIQRLLAPRGADVAGISGELARAIGDACAAAKITLDFASTGEGALAPLLAHAVRRIAREATTNAIKHSGARRLVVRLDATEDEVALTIEDDGRGYPDPRPPGHGLGIMRRRAERIGGSLSATRGHLGGAKIEARLPRAPRLTAR